MSIEIYDRAKKVYKDGTVYYLLKWGSKNCFSLPYETRVDDTLHTQYLRRQARESDWRVIAKRPLQSNGMLADTYWNDTTGGYYGKIRFGNKRNIALYLDKAPIVEYEEMDDDQKANFHSILRYTEGVDQKYRDAIIDLENIPENKQVRLVNKYCGTETPMTNENSVEWKNKRYWNLDNL